MLAVALQLKLASIGIALLAIIAKSSIDQQIQKSPAAIAAGQIPWTLRGSRVQFTGVTLATRPPWRWIICWASSILSKVTNRTVLLRLCRR